MFSVSTPLLCNQFIDRSMEKPSCLWSYWWQGPVYFTIAAMLAFLAINAAFHASTSSNSTTSIDRITLLHLSSNSSAVLRNSGFNIFATMMQLSPDQFTPSSSPLSNHYTVFAVRDSAIHSLDPLILKDLIKYQTVAANLSIDQMLKEDETTCFETLLRFKNVSITRKVAKKRLIEINHVPISQPDLILEDGITVHGVLSPFVPLHELVAKDHFSSVPNPNCGLMSESANRVQWMKIIRSLRSKGFAASAQGLLSVHPILVKDYSNLTSITIFAPPDFGSEYNSLHMELADVIEVHILPRRMTYHGLDSLHEGTRLKTLYSAKELVISGRSGNATSSQNVICVGGVEITRPNVIEAKNFIVHGVSRAFQIIGHDQHHLSS